MKRLAAMGLVVAFCCVGFHACDNEKKVTEPDLPPPTTLVANGPVVTLPAPLGPRPSPSSSPPVPGGVPTPTPSPTPSPSPSASPTPVPTPTPTPAAPCPA